MKTIGYEPQSYKWARIRVELPDDANTNARHGQIIWSGNADVEVIEDGTTYWVSVTPSADAEPVSVMAVNFEGRVFVSAKTPDLGAVYVANKGNWSGGGRYHGVAVGREGCRVVCKCGGQADYYQVVGGAWAPSKPLQQ